MDCAAAACSCEFALLPYSVRGLTHAPSLPFIFPFTTPAHCRTDFDLGLFEETLPPLDPSNSRADISHLETYSLVYRYFTLPLQLASACRMVHTAVTGPEARRKNAIDEERLQRAWGILDKAWSEIDQIRTSELSATAFTSLEIEAYIASWKIFMFECSKRGRSFSLLLTSSNPYARQHYSRSPQTATR
jgi:hypothetical protein